MIMQYICLFIFKKEEENICLGEVDSFALQHRHFLGSFCESIINHSTVSWYFAKLKVPKDPFPPF